MFHQHTEALIAELQDVARQIRLDVLDMVYRRGAGHPGGSYSAAEILAALYFHHMRIDPTRPDWRNVIGSSSSKGHAAAALYSVLAQRGYFPRDDLKKWGHLGAHLQGHPDRVKTPGVEMSSGFLGHGLSIGVGMALAQRLGGPRYNIYVMMSDGCIQSGVAWEGALLASKYRTSEVIVIMDYNDVQLDGAVHDILPLEPLIDKFRAFGFAVLEINGHNLREVLDALDHALEVHSLPTVIVAHTTKGKGVSYMENAAAWHGAVPNKEQYDIARAEVLQGDHIMTNIPQRQAYGVALADYGDLNPDVVVLDADVSSSTLTKFFANRHPDRFFNVGVVEAAMVNLAVGFALGGRIPFVNTFAALLTLRACEQIRTCVGYAATNVKLIGGYAGVSDYKDGPTHFAINDIALMRSLPDMVVLAPADNIEAAKMIAPIAEYDGPVYARISRAGSPDVFNGMHEFVIGKGVTVRNGGDVTLVGTGSMTYRCVQAADILAREGIDARVLNMHTIKPLDVALLRQSADETGALVTAEEHSVIGGLGGAAVEALARERPVPVEFVGLQDTFCQTGPDPETLMDASHLSVGDIVEAAKRVLLRKA